MIACWAIDDSIIVELVGRLDGPAHNVTTAWVVAQHPGCVWQLLCSAPLVRSWVVRLQRGSRQGSLPIIAYREMRTLRSLTMFEVER